MKVVKLQYIGKTEVLKITQPHLSRPYTFDKSTDSIAMVLYEDAKVMLEQGPKSYKVVSGILEAGPDDLQPAYMPSPPPISSPTLPPIVEDIVHDPESSEPVLTGDGVEGTGDMPPIEEPPAPVKKGGKKGK